MSKIIPDDLTKLEPSERLLLMARLWDSLDDQDLGLTLAQAEELDRRLADLDAERSGATSWEQLKSELSR